MRTLYLVCLIITVVGAAGAALHGTPAAGPLDFLLGQRSVGGDFLRIIVLLSAAITLLRGLRHVKAANG